MNRAPLHWTRAAGQRLAALWAYKFVGITAGMTLFFAGYFWVLHHPAREVIIMPVTALDLWIGFHPAALPLYLSLWMYVSLSGGLMGDKRELAAGALGALGLAVAGLGIFMFLPTRVPPFAITWAPDSAFAFLKNIDASGNACPSLHVAFALYSAGVIGRQLRQLSAGAAAHTLNTLWCAGIIASTIATRQHVVYDVGAGLLFGALFLAGYLFFARRLTSTAPSPE